MARVHEVTQQFIALSNQVAEGGDYTPLTDYLSQLVPGEYNEIADQLDVLGKDTQAAALRKLGAQREVDALTPLQRQAAANFGIAPEKYLEMMKKGKR